MEETRRVRRSELVGIDLADLKFGLDGLIVTLRRSKTGPEGQGRRVGIPFGSHPETCPLCAAQDWIDLLDATSGPLFQPINRHGHIGAERLSDKAVALIVKRCARAAGLRVTRWRGTACASAWRRRPPAPASPNAPS
jgi:hypothetical protein